MNDIHVHGVVEEISWKSQDGEVSSIAIAAGMEVSIKMSPDALRTVSKDPGLSRTDLICTTQPDQILLNGSTWKLDGGYQEISWSLLTPTSVPTPTTVIFRFTPGNMRIQSTSSEGS